jgi:hypothetical protein
MSIGMFVRTVTSVSPGALLNRTRRNHALEHATLNLLMRRYPSAQIAGLSGPLGFTLLSSLTAEQIIPAIRESLDLLRAGQSDLAVHEHCGTNLVITAALTTFATVAGLGAYALPRNRQTRAPLALLERLPHVVLLNVVALIAASPLSRWVQANVTTNADLRDLEIVSILTDYQGRLHRISVQTREAEAAQRIELAA